MSTEIQKADAAARLRIVKWLIVAALVGFVLLMLAQPIVGEISVWAFGNPERAGERISILIIVLSVTSVVPLALIAKFLLRFASAITTADRYPPPGWPVTRDTKIVRGPRAAARARALRVLASLLALGALIMVYLYWRLWNLLASLPLDSTPVA